MKKSLTGSKGGNRGSMVEEGVEEAVAAASDTSVHSHAWEARVDTAAGIYNTRNVLRLHY